MEKCWHTTPKRTRVRSSLLNVSALMFSAPVLQRFLLTQKLLFKGLFD